MGADKRESSVRAKRRHRRCDRRGFLARIGRSRSETEHCVWARLSRLQLVLTADVWLVRDRRQRMGICNPSSKWNDCRVIRFNKHEDVIVDAFVVQNG
jgi:hypothetical protein